ncbi:MAG: amino acid ABC transporter substrate-binding protein, partial [Erysipelotrichaceae bacterium]|nr:amino acid ABC transporter substrate-binding protein [Erysipelotrichaceae bacterium]
MKKLLSAAAACMLCAAMAACSSASKTEDSKTADGQAEPKEILIGISPDYPPYESKNTAREIEGFDVDMTKWLFDWMNKNGAGYEYELVEMNFDTIIANLQTDQIDLGISGFTYDKDREGIFSDSYYDSAHVIVVPTASKISSWDDLKGKRVGVQQGSVS